MKILFLHFMKLKQLKEYFSFNQKEINNKHTIAVKIVEPTHYIVPYQMLYVLPTKIFSVIDNFLLFFNIILFLLLITHIHNKCLV